MTKTLRKLTITLLLIVIRLSIYSQNEDKLFDIGKNIEIYTNVYKELNKNFVDEVDPAILMRTGIDAMTKSLDPYTVYYSESEAESYKIAMEGKYSGIGVVMNNIDSVLTVIEMYKDSPAYNAGMRIGDRITEINGKSTSGKSLSDITNVVRGAPGTFLNLKIKHYGDNQTFDVKITRKEIDIPNVPFEGMVNDSIGYIQLTTFTENAGENVRQSLKKLKDSFNIKGVILDLRNNGGGLLREAINVANVFIDNNEELVFTRGKGEDQNKSYKTLKNAADKEIPLAILINDKTASASEIVSGSVQDLDRGVIIGQKSFGKGLVQNFFEVGYNSRIKTTISKYFIPSGRCIQSKIYENGKAIQIDKNKQNEFSTRNGRKVYDIGGIEPDITVNSVISNDFIKNLIKENMIFKYANEYNKQNPNISPIEIIKTIHNQKFVDYLKQSDFKYRTLSEQKLDDLIKTLKETKVTVDEANFDNLKSQINSTKKDMETSSMSYVNSLINRELISRLYLKDTAKYLLHDDKDINEAIRVISDRSEYNKILNKSK